MILKLITLIVANKSWLLKLIGMIRGSASTATKVATVNKSGKLSIIKLTLIVSAIVAVAVFEIYDLDVDNVMAILNIFVCAA